jgi:hypothetical protein
LSFPLLNFISRNGFIVKKNEMRIADSNFDRLQARSGLTAKNQSQMSKIIPMLQIGSKAGLDEEQTLKKAEDRVLSLEALALRFEDATRKLWTLHKVDHDRQMKRLTIALEFLVLASKSKPPHGTSKGLRSCINEMTSLREAAYMDELTTAVIDLSSMKEFHVLLLKLLERAKLDLQNVGTVVETNHDPVFGTEIVDVIRSTVEQSVLPSLVGKPYVVAKVPVIPVAKSILSLDVLRSRGFTCVSLGGYPVIKNQLVLGINPQELGLTDKEKADGISIPRARWLDAANRIRLAIRKETKQKIAFVDERPYGTAGTAWFWLMLESELQEFTSAFPGKSLQLRNWGVAS